VGLIEHVQDGEVDVPYPARTLVIVGSVPFLATNWGMLPHGMSFSVVSGELSGTPTVSGVFSFTVGAQAGNDPVVRKTYMLTIADAGAVVTPATNPPSSTPPDAYRVRKLTLSVFALVLLGC
jgi:hypothetical protein